MMAKSNVVEFRSRRPKSANFGQFLLIQSLLETGRSVRIQFVLSLLMIEAFGKQMALAGSLSRELVEIQFELCERFLAPTKRQ